MSPHNYINRSWCQQNKNKIADKKIKIEFYVSRMYIDDSMQNVNRWVDTNISIEVNVSKMYVYESMQIISSSRYKLDDKIGKTIVVREWDPILYFKNLWNNKQ